MDKSYRNSRIAILLTCIFIFVSTIDSFAMQIFINVLENGKHITLEVEPTDRIEDVKQAVENKEAIPVDRQILKLGETILENENTLQDYSIVKDDTLNLHKLYKVNYDSNGATGDVPTDTNMYVTSSSVFILDIGNINKPEYEFIGWTLDQVGDSDVYSPGEYIQILEKDIVLYAKWKSIESEPKPTPDPTPVPKPEPPLNSNKKDKDDKKSDMAKGIEAPTIESVIVSEPLSPFVYEINIDGRIDFTNIGGYKNQLPLIMYNNRIYISLIDLGNIYQLRIENIKWNKENRTVTFRVESEEWKLLVDNNLIEREESLENISMKIIDERLYIQLKDFSELMNSKLEWDSISKKIKLEIKNQ